MGKFCPKCGNEVTNADSKFCNKCGTSLEQNNTNTSNNKKNDNGLPYMVLAIVIFIFIYLIFVVFLGSISNKTEYSDVSDDNDKTSFNSDYVDYGTATTTTSTTTTAPKKKVYGYNETFEFDNLEITIGEKLVFKKVDNRFSDYNGKTVVGIPFTVKNLNQETHSLNMFYYKVFGSVGTEIETVNSYFKDNLDYAGDLRPNASYTKYTYCLYDGDGIYSIEFDNHSDKKLVEINVKK